MKQCRECEKWNEQYKVQCICREPIFSKLSEDEYL